jgi:hypothetical protein
MEFKQEKAVKRKLGSCRTEREAVDTNRNRKRE